MRSLPAINTIIRDLLSNKTVEKHLHPECRMPVSGDSAFADFFSPLELFILDYAVFPRGSPRPNTCFSSDLLFPFRASPQCRIIRIPPLLSSIKSRHIRVVQGRIQGETPGKIRVGKKRDSE